MRTTFWLAIFLIVVIFLAQTSIFQKENYAKDFSWVVGRLEFNPLEGGFWQVRFGKESDPYGGKFVLGNDPRLSQFKSGDLVKITGKISLEQISIYQAGTIYQITSIEKINQ